MNIVYVQARRKYIKHTMPILIFFSIKKIAYRKIDRTFSKLTIKIMGLGLHDAFMCTQLQGPNNFP